MVLGRLQRCVRAAQHLDFALQQPALRVGFLLRESPALADEHDPPTAYSDDQQQHEEDPRHRAGLDIGFAQRQVAILGQRDAHDGGKHQRQREKDNEESPRARLHARGDPGGENVLQPAGQLFVGARPGLAGVMATRVERAAQGADRRAVGRALRHVGRLETILAHAAGERASRVGHRRRLARDVPATLAQPRKCRRKHQRRAKREEGRKGARRLAKEAVEREQCQRGRNDRGAQPHGVDVVEIGAPEFESLRGKPERLVDDKVRHDRADPGERDVAIEAKDLLERTEHPQRHQQRGDRDVEHQPDDPPRVAVGEPREEIRPRKRSGVGIRDVDLDLRQHDKEHRHRHNPGGIVKNVGKARQVHARRFAGLLGRALVLQHQEGEECAAQHFRHAGQDPARSGHHDGGPPAPPVGAGLRGQKPQVIDLLADMHDQRAPDRAGGAEHEPVKAAVAREVTGEAGKGTKGARITDGDGHVGQGQEHEPKPLCPGL